MNADIDSLAVLIRKMEEELFKVIELLVNKDGILKDSDAVFLLLYRKIIEKIDAVFILCDNGHQGSSESLTRDVFENYLHLAYINQGNYEYRTKAYQYENLVNQSNIIDWFDPKSHSGKKLKKFLGTDKRVLPNNMIKRKEYINKRLNSEELNNINIDWNRKLKERGKGRKQSKYPTWYNVGNGPEDISQLSSLVGMGAEYRTIYSLFSYQVHSLNALNQIQKIGDNLGALTPIRDEVREGLSIQVSNTLGILALKIIIEKFHQEGKDLFLKWYTKDFRKEIAKEKNMKQ